MVKNILSSPSLHSYLTFIQYMISNLEIEFPKLLNNEFKIVKTSELFHPVFHSLFPLQKVDPVFDCAFFISCY